MSFRSVVVVLVLVCTCFSNQRVLAQATNLGVADSLFSNTLNEQRHFWVQLPENYDPEGSVAYPVVYVLDGSVLLPTLETVYENYWGHYLPHMILVGISNRTSRTRDLTTSDITERRGATMEQANGGAETFTQFIATELMPYVDANYLTTSYRTLIGHSYAGLFTINTLIHHPELFTNYLAIDPSLDWDDQKLLKQAKAKLKTENFKGKALFVSLAAEQLHMQNEAVTLENVMEDTSEFSLFARSIIDFSQFAETQKQNGLHFSWQVYPNDLHGTVPLPSMRDGLVFMFEWYQFKSPQKYNDPNATVAELEALLDAQEKILTENFGYPTPPMIEELFNGYGYMHLQMGMPDKAKLFFQKNIDYYPKSANAYDSMADYYESQDNTSEALKCVTKAYELSGNENYKKRMQALKVKD